MDHAQREVVAVHHVGDVGENERMIASGWKTIRVVFHNFAGLEQPRNQKVESGEIICHGYKWTLILYPRGQTLSLNDDQVGLRLKCVDCPVDGTKAMFKISSGQREILSSPSWQIFRPTDAWGSVNALKRSHVLDPSKNFLQDGNLTFDVVLQVQQDGPTIWTPSNTVCSDMLKILDRADAESADVHFSVISQDEEKPNSSFYSHRAILAVRCPALAELAEDCNVDKPIPIQDISPDMFRMLLRFIYGGDIPPKKVLTEESRTIIRAANEYGCTGLKLTAEAELARGGITTENAAELILFADGTDCAMLKEVAMDYFVANAQAVMASAGFEQLKESPAIMAELMKIGFGSKKRPAETDVNESRDYKRMRVATLRRELDAKGLDVDGSREMLLSRLREAAAAQAEKEAAEADVEAQDGNAEAQDEE